MRPERRFKPGMDGGLRAAILIRQSLHLSNAELSVQCLGSTSRVGIGPYICSQKFVTNPTVDGLDAPIIEVADHGDDQQVTVQVPWEYVRYPIQSNGNVCQGVKQVSVSQSGMTTTSALNGAVPSSYVFLDSDGYVLAQHSSDLSWLSADNPAHPGEQNHPTCREPWLGRQSSTYGTRHPTPLFDGNLESWSA